MKVKYLFVTAVSVLFILTSCNQRQKQVDAIKVQAKYVDSIVANVPVMNPEDRAKTTTLIDDYKNFVTKYPDDSIDPVFLYNAAVLETKVPDMQGAVDIFIQLADSYPKSKLAPESLLAAGGIYELGLQKCDKAKAAYERIKDNYPDASKAYQIDMVIENVCKPASEMLDSMQGEKIEDSSAVQK